MEKEVLSDDLFSSDHELSDSHSDEGAIGPISYREYLDRSKSGQRATYILQTSDLSSEEDAPTKQNASDKRRAKASTTVTFRTTQGKPKRRSRSNTTKTKCRMTSARSKKTKVQSKKTPVRPIPIPMTSRTTQQLASVMSSTPADDSVILSAAPTHGMPNLTVIPTHPLPGGTPTHPLPGGTPKVTSEMLFTGCQSQ